MNRVQWSVAELHLHGGGRTEFGQGAPEQALVCPPKFRLGMCVGGV